MYRESHCSASSTVSYSRNCEVISNVRRRRRLDAERIGEVLMVLEVIDNGIVIDQGIIDGGGWG